MSEDDKRFLRSFWDKVPKDVRPTLLRAVNAEKGAGKNPSEVILSRILNLTRLNLGHAQLGDAEFLRDFKRLVHLDLDNGQLSSLAAVAGHTKLETLSIKKTGTSSLALLAGLTRLETLSCGENPLTSLEGLSSLHRLSYLHAPDGSVSDLAPLSGLAELEDLTVYSNPVSDLSPLANCKSLKEISCFSSAKPLRGLPSLKGLVRLETVSTSECPKADVAALRKNRPDLRFGLDGDHTPPLRTTHSDADLDVLRKFWDNRKGLGTRWVKKLHELLEKSVFDKHDADKLTDKQLIQFFGGDSIWVDELGLDSLVPLKHFRSVDYLNASGNNVTSLEPLAGHKWLKTLFVNGNAIGSLAPLAKLRRLEDLWGEENRLTSLKGLEDVRSLRTLQVKQNQITDLSALRELTDLRELSVLSNHVASLEPLSKLVRLHTLCAYDNAFSDLSPLAGCDRLQVVECFANPGLKNVMALKNLPQLRQVVSHGALPRDEVVAFSRVRPDVEID